MLPEFAHWNVGMLEVFHYIGRKHIACGRFVCYGQPVLSAQFRHTLVKTVHHQFVYGSAPVAQETRCGFGGVYDIPHKSRQPRAQVIASHLPELRFHVFCPCLCFAFPTVQQHAVQQSCQRTSFQTPYVSVKVFLCSFGVKLVALPSRGLWRSRGIFHAAVHMPYAQDGPFSFGSVPT